jgi:hypothetical protein
MPGMIRAPNIQEQRESAEPPKSKGTQNRVGARTGSREPGQVMESNTSKSGLKGKHLAQASS